VRRDDVRNLLPGEHFWGTHVVRGGGDTGERLSVFAPHRSAVPGHGAGALPKRVFGLASGECVEVSQPPASLREGDVGEEAEAGVGGREGCGGDDIADGEEDVDWEGEQGQRHRVWLATCDEVKLKPDRMTKGLRGTKRCIISGTMNGP